MTTKKFTILIAITVCGQFLQSQETSSEGGGEIEIVKEGECLSNTQRIQIQSQVSENVELLEEEGVLNLEKTKSTPVFFEWPMRKANGMPFNDYYGIAYFVDHDPEATGSHAGKSNLDYNCGNRSYDNTDGYNHRGTDYYLWPFPWYQYENDFVEVIAAADGVIVYKHDGETDDECRCSEMWNAIYLQHADGSTSWYGHLKQNALTAKTVGQTVAQGEYLGVVGSSGCSRWPHLHFEVYDASRNLIDPYAGPCNGMNTKSWWANQPEYRTPTLNALLTHYNIPIDGCTPDSEHPYIENAFAPGQTVYFATYYHDQIEGDQTFLRVKKPDGSIWDNWIYQARDTANHYWWYWGYPMPEEGPFGTWTFEAEYRGEIFQHSFKYGDVCIDPNEEDVNAGVLLKAKVYLQGAYINSSNNFMRDDLRITGVLPTTEPYSNLTGFNHVCGGGGEQVQEELFSFLGENSIVDWVFLEMRDEWTNEVLATRSALLQKDGDIVDVDGFSPVKFDLVNGQYKVCVRHRNHLSVTTLHSLTFDELSPTICDFNNIPVYGVNAIVEMPFEVNALWGGLAEPNGQIIFQGPNNGVNASFFEVLNAPDNIGSPSYIYRNAYSQTDYDMNGRTIYQGLDTDANFIFFNILNHPNNMEQKLNFIIKEQKP